MKDKVITIVLLIIMFICIYIMAEQEEIKESRINNIENTIENHTHYIDKLEADLDNLYRMVE